MIKLKVERMTCGGCAATVKAAVLKVAPTARVEIEIATGALGVEGDADEAAFVLGVVPWFGQRSRIDYLYGGNGHCRTDLPGRV